MKKIIVIVISLLIVILLLSLQIQPTIQELAKKEMDHFIQLVINHVSFVSEIDNSELFNTENQTFQFNMVYLNSITGQYVNDLEEVLLQIQEGHYQNNSQSIYNKYLKKISDNKGIVASLPLGMITNNVFFENLGPHINVKYKTKSLVSSQIDKEVKSYGINHMLVTIDLTITVELQIIVPFQKNNYEKKYQIPLVFEIIEGEVPSWYQSPS